MSKFSTCLQELKWDNHITFLASMFCDLLERGNFLDVTLEAVGGHLVKAHRLILCAASPYFEVTFNLNVDTFSTQLKCFT